MFNPYFGCVATLEVFKSMVWKKRDLKTLIRLPRRMPEKCIEHMSKTTPWRCRKCISPKCNICRIFGNIAIGVLNINILLLGKEGELWTKEHFESEAPLLGPTRSLYCMREKNIQSPQPYLETYPDNKYDIEIPFRSQYISQIHKKTFPINWTNWPTR